MRARGLSRGHDRHRRAPGRMPADRRVDRAAARDVARRERRYLAGHRSRLQRRAPARYARPGFSRRRAGRSCPCRADGRCRRAARARAAARDAAARSASVPSQLPAPGWTTSPAGLSTTSRRLVLGDDGEQRSLRAERRFARQRFRHRPPRRFRRRALRASARRMAVLRHASGVDPGSGAVRAKTAASARESATSKRCRRRRRPAASAHGLRRREGGLGATPRAVGRRAGCRVVQSRRRL